MSTLFVSFVKNEDGATAIEYALIASATGLAIAAVMPTLGVNLGAKFTAVATALL